MKKFLLLLIFPLLGSILKAQDIQENISYGFDEYIEKCTNIPTVRNINGGTIFNVTYGDGWTLEMKGAFEYACKIWEENLPTCLPINIKAEIGTIRGSLDLKALSKINIPSYPNWSEMNDGIAPLRSQIKAVVLMESEKGYSNHFVDSIPDESFFDDIDFTIIYNESMLDQFSFSLYSTPTDKYDFVSLVLRDIAKGLGVSSKIRGSASTKTIYSTGADPTKFESLIWSKIAADDASQRYINATQGQVNIDVNNYGTLNLYAPTDWQDGLSLNTFIPDTAYKITELLSYEFGRGCVIRNIADSKYCNFFESALGWFADTTSGNNQTSISISGNTENVIPYGGSISFNESETTNIDDIISDETYSISRSTTLQSATSDFNSLEYCKPYHPYYISDDKSVDETGWSVSILKKDSTWDIVYTFGYPAEIYRFDMNEFTFHYGNSDYARTCDGYLRARFTRSYTYTNSVRQYHIYDVHYYALDYLPQKPEIEFDQVVESVSTYSTTDEYLRDIKIGLKNMEGIEQVFVEQLDEWDTLPFLFEVTDFKNGYFIATVDKEFQSQFTVVAYNKNGNARSETITVAPLEPATNAYTVNLSDNEIEIESTNQRISAIRTLTSYSIQTLDQNNSLIMTGNIDGENASIDISSLNNGMYVLNYYDNRNNKYSTKFHKK